MNYDLILKNVARHISLDPDEKHFFISLLKPRVFRRKDFILREGDVARHTNFVTEGCLRKYTIGKDGKLYIDYFAPENHWLADLCSYLTETPASQNIDALEDTQVLQLSKANMERLCTEVPKFDRLNRTLFQNSLVLHHRRLMTNISGTAKDRYLEFRRKYPGLELRIPQKQIAAYLGITPEYISMLRKQLMQE